MHKSKLTAREKARQERERAKSFADRSRQQMKRSARLREKSRYEEATQAATRIAQEATEKT